MSDKIIAICIRDYSQSDDWPHWTNGPPAHTLTAGRAYGVWMGHSMFGCESNEGTDYVSLTFDRDQFDKYFRIFA